MIIVYNNMIVYDKYKIVYDPRYSNSIKTDFYVILLSSVSTVNAQYWIKSKPEIYI